MGKNKHKNLKYLIPALVVSIIVLATTVGASSDFLGMVTSNNQNQDLPDLTVTYAGIDSNGYIKAEVTNKGKVDVTAGTAGQTGTSTGTNNQNGGTSTTGQNGTNNQGGDNQQSVDLYPAKAAFLGDHQEKFVAGVCTSSVPAGTTKQMNVDLKIINSENKSEIFKKTYTVSGLTSSQLCKTIEVPTKDFSTKFSFQTKYFALVYVDPTNTTIETDEQNNEGVYMFEPIILTPQSIEDVCDGKSTRLDPAGDAKDKQILKMYSPM